MSGEYSTDGTNFFSSSSPSGSSGDGIFGSDPSAEGMTEDSFPTVKDKVELESESADGGIRCSSFS